MPLDAIVRLGLLVSIGLVALSLGAHAPPQRALYVLRRPGLLVRVLIAMFVVMPAFAILLAAVTSIPPAIKFAIVAMSVGPVPPVLPAKQMKAGGEADYVVGLLAAASLLSIVLTPLLIALAATLLGADAAVSAREVAKTLLISTGLPFAAGMILRGVWAKGADPIGDIAQKAGTALLLVVFVLMVAASWREMTGLLHDGGALAIVATIAVGLLAGHLLGQPPNRGALALATASRHPGVALAIAGASFPEAIKPITAAVLLFLLISMLVTPLYVRWVRGRTAKLAAT